MKYRLFLLYRVQEDTQSLHIKSIRRDQGGELLCIASNGVGPDLSKTVKVVVKGEHRVTSYDLKLGQFPFNYIINGTYKQNRGQLIKMFSPSICY